MFISQEVFIMVIIIAIFMPVISVITLFMVYGFEKEFRLIVANKQQEHLEEKYRNSEYIQLNTQIQPHFLFNTLNLILGYARIEENEQLINTLEKFSMYLKYNYQVQDDLIPLYKEYQHAKNYLAIQQARFGSTLEISYKFDPDIKYTLVPPFIIQTLTENAFKHGLENKTGGKKLHIILEKEGSKVVIQVLDNGIELEGSLSSETSSSKYGLKNIQDRLIFLFGNDIDIKLNALEQGTMVCLKFPLLFQKSGEEI